MISNWLISKKIDLSILFLPVWLSWLFCFLLPEEILDKDLSLGLWVVFVLCIDVTHVWSTLWRTYLSPDDRKHHKTLLLIAPIASLLLVSSISMVSEQLFWSILAYFAIYHFMKQQVGFMKIYQRKAHIPEVSKWFTHERLIFFSMIMPVIYWHLMPNSAFKWFDGSSFFTHYFDWALSINTLKHIRIWFELIYWSVIASWLFLLFKNPYVRLKTMLPMLLWLLTTSINWYLGIIYFNSDVAFSITNIVAHGIPYLTLVLWYRWRKLKLSPKKQTIKAPKLIAVSLGLILTLALCEEYLWDTAINLENNLFFLPEIYEMFQDPIWRAIAIGLLSIPQVAHYIIDGYIWKSNSKNPLLKPILFGSK